MKLPKFLQVFKDLAIFLIISLIFIIALFTVPLPVPLGAQVVGAFQLVAFPTGLAFYQNVAKSHFYSVSPLDDFVLDAQGNKSTLANLAQLQIANKNATQTQTQLSQPHDVLTGIENYFGHSSLDFSSPKSTFPTKYSAEIQDQHVTITREITTSESQTLAASGMTLKFGNDDFIFDENGQMYNLKTPAEIALFNQFYGINLLKPLTSEAELARFDADRAQLPNKITISNPNLNGLIVVEAGPNQTLWINRISNAIEVVEPISDPSSKIITNTMHLTVLNQPEEKAQK